MCRILHPPSRRRPRYHLRPRRADGVSAAFVLFLLAAAAGSAQAVAIDLPIAVDTHLDSRSKNGADHWNFGADHTDKVVVNSQDDPTSLCRALFRLPEDLSTYLR